MSTELATWDPQSMGEAMAYANMLSKSPLMPKHLFNQAASVFLIMAKGRELGVPPLVAIDGIDVIQGKVALKPQMMLGLVRKRTDVCKYLTCTETTDKVATFETHRVGDPKPTSLSFTIEDARKMQLASKENWGKQPAVMLRWRAASAICRLIYSDLLNGAYVFGEIPGGHTEEEIQPAVETGTNRQRVVSPSGALTPPPADVVTVEPVTDSVWDEAPPEVSEEDVEDPEVEELRMPDQVPRLGGKKISDLTIKDLKYWSAAFAASTEKPNKERWRDQNLALAAGCLAELAKREA